MGLIFEWDEAKARANHKRHTVTFKEAATAFGDPLSLTIQDQRHSEGENRFVIIGRSHTGRTLVVVHTERGDRIRIIGARVATRRERRQYEEAEN